MKKIFIAILSLLFINGYSQGINYTLYARKCNTNGSIDSIYIKMFTDSLFINGSFVQFSKGHFDGLFGPNYPNGFENYVQRADGVWINTNCFVNNATIVPTTVQTALDSKSPTSHTHTYSSLTSKPTTLSGYGITDGVANTITVNGHALSGNVSVTTTDLSLQNVDNTSDASKPVSTATQTALNLKANIASPTFTGTVGGITASMVGLGNVTNESKSTMFTSPAFTGTPTGITATHVGLGNVNNTSDASKPVSTATQTALDLKANLASPTFTGTVTLPASTSLITPSLGAATATTINGNTITTGSSTYTGTAAKTYTFPASTATVVGRVATAQIASTASATSTTTLFTPPADGYYRITIYLKITTTGTSPVAGPVTITYTDGLGSVAQSHVMLLQSVTGTVVTTTVNNSTTTGTVNGSMVIYAKASVAIQYAIAVSGTFGAGRYQAFLTCEAL